MFKIGEFSKIAQVPGSLLRYYDEIELLKPAHVDPFTGYRYYSAHQLPRLHRILALKELGLTLDQVRQLVDDAIGPEEIRGMLMLKKAQVKQSVYEELVRLRHIESRLHQIEANEEVTFDVILKSVPAQPFLSLRERIPALDVGFELMQEIVQFLPAQVAQPSLGYFTAVVHSESLEANDIDIEMGFVLNHPADLTVSLSDEHMMTTRTLPAVPIMATVTRVGGFENNYHSYGTIGLWVEEHGYRLDGNGREVLIQPPQQGRTDDMVTEIQFPVTPIGPADLLPMPS